MKISKIILTIAIIFTCASSCTDFLVEKPKNMFVVDNFYSNENDAVAAANAVYQVLYPIYTRTIYLLNALPTDDMKNGIGMPNANLQDLEYMRYATENTFVSQMWQHNYSGISRANTAVLNIPKINMDEGLKNRLVAEARFLRALYYFNLVRFFGDVPVILDLQSVEDAIIPRTAKEEVYNQIIADLQFAETHLPASYVSESGRATKGAAKILLGKVYLTRNDHQNAVDKLAEVIENEGTYGYGLHAAYGDNWQIETENGQEMVFSIEFMEPPGTGNNEMTANGPKYSIHEGGGIPGLTPGWESDIPTVDLYTQFVDEDERKDITFKLDYYSPKTKLIYTSSIPLFGKYWEEGETVPRQSDANMHIIRYADALLMYAEALNEVGQTPTALIHLNRVRERAFNNSTYNYAGLSQEQFRQAVWQERRLELALEGHRWFDLVRTGRLVEVMKAHGATEAALAESNKTEITANADAHHVLFPIPQREVDLNKDIQQNTGY